MIPYAENKKKAEGYLGENELEMMKEPSAAQKTYLVADESPDETETSEITRDFQAARRILKCVEREFKRMSPEGAEYARMRIQKLLDHS